MTATALGVALVFIIGYAFVVAENLTRIAKPATALVMAAAGWMLCAMNACDGGRGGLAAPQVSMVAEALSTTTAEACATLLYLMEAMIVVAAVDAAGGFEAMARKFCGLSLQRLMFEITATTFAVSMILDNVTTTIVMLAVVRRLVECQSTRRWFAVMVVVAANAGGAASPIGDVTSLLLWTGGMMDAGRFLTDVLPASLVSVSVPLAAVCARVRKIKEEKTGVTDVGKFVAGAHGSAVLETPSAPAVEACSTTSTSGSTQSVVVVSLALLVFAAVPIFVTLTGLPPFVALMPAVAVVWQVCGKRIDTVLRRVNMPTLIFLLGVLLAVGALKEGGALDVVAHALPEGACGAVAVGLLSALVDNVPLVSAAVATFARDVAPAFWPSLAYGASVGGSLLVTGSAAGVVAMDEMGINFGWFVRTMTLPVLAGAALGWLLL